MNRQRIALFTGMINRKNAKTEHTKTAMPEPDNRLHALRISSRKNLTETISVPQVKI
ncbi:hypothetical protein [Treponema sp. Marseille-Q4132]|uniref:hypothetical protein n=1 Tax=Treponema sp. Marseille-Q4132 TaxID=2766701 RepID=UPI001652DD1D|nr:hypothetical protein [Treponema sp. Marseille-Q4132]QNL98079.1 hypothetical protein H9I35_04870 [Treponema sp. Marseille-Q4132]